MAFPTLGILDDFNRSNVSPPSASWSSGHIQSATATALGVNSNQLASSSTTSNSFLLTSYGPDQEAYCTVATKPANGEYVALFMRIHDEGTSTWDGYALIWIVGTTNDTWVLRRYDNGAITQLASFNSLTVVAGEKIGMSVTGSKLQLWKTVSGTWGQVGTDTTDTTYSAAGKIGIELSTTLIRVDDLGGGTISGAVDATVTAVASTGLGSAPVAAVSGSSAGTVNAVTALGLGSAPTAAPSASATITAVVVDATGAGPPANQMISAVIAAPPATGSGSALAATVGSGAGGATVTGVTALALGSALAGSLSVGATVTAVAAPATGAGIAGAVQAGATVQAVPALAAGLALRPVLSPAPAGGSGLITLPTTFAEDSA